MQQGEGREPEGEELVRAGTSEEVTQWELGKDVWESLV